ncbi:hypothetical protein KSZ_53650 [Dictyobacter formicarum]|uniref:Pyrrolo-quinoline quinone repeat domain-containing protein n=1 Tax=Dictyobacter formicarum TaxID=2778368 RepID=A0ABQ3VMC5_9CHLR|nr:hypothetical protein KSZ_53650 [Dictyobacter formicarum]
MPSSFTITLSANGTVYCIAVNYLYAVDEATGKLQWKQHSLELARFTQLYLVNGIIYTVTGNYIGDSDSSGTKSRVYAFAASNGKLLWTTPIGHGLLTENVDVVPIASTALLSQNGYLFVNSNLKNGHTIQALNMKDGKVAWQVNVPMSTIYVSGRIANHALYLTNANVALPRQFVSIDPRTGELLASRTLTQSYKSTGILGNDSQHIYLGIGSEPGIIRAITSVRLSDSSMLWQKQLTTPSDRIYQVVMAP